MTAALTTPQGTSSDCAEEANDAIASGAACGLAVAAASAPAAGWLLVGMAYTLCIQAMYAIEDAAQACGVTDTGSTEGSSDGLPDELQRAKEEVQDALEELGVIFAS